MRMTSRLNVVIVAVTAAVGLAAPAEADTRPRCPLAMLFICAALPSVPDLDHDIDLTKDPGGTDTAGGGSSEAPALQP